jgi:deazaflavin-dependent oxidoreductase (nitroreductase family)
MRGGAKSYRRSLWRRALNGLVRPLARLGLTGPRTHLLTVPGRTTGRLWSTPVSIVRDDDERWLVAPFGDRNWVKNARAAGWVELRRGRLRERLTVEELSDEKAIPVLRRYFELSRLTRPFFDVELGSSNADWLAEAPRHPVFRLRASTPDRVDNDALSVGSAVS